MKMGVVARAVEGEGEREKETYARPVQEENALMESEAFSNALKGGFLAFALVCVAFLLKLSQPVIGEMIDAFPKGGRCLLYTSPSPRDRTRTRMPSSA